MVFIFITTSVISYFAMICAAGGSHNLCLIWVVYGPQIIKKWLGMVQEIKFAKKQIGNVQKIISVIIVPSPID